MVAAVLALLLAGLLVGNSIPWGAKSLTVESGTVMLHDAGSGFSSFESDGGDVMGFNATAVSWTGAGREGTDGPPPCLRANEAVPAEVGYTAVELPDGGQRPFVLWVRCG